MVIVFAFVFEQPLTAVTSRTTEKIPGVVKVMLGFGSVDNCKSPKSHLCPVKLPDELIALKLTGLFTQMFSEVKSMSGELAEVIDIVLVLVETTVPLSKSRDTS